MMNLDLANRIGGRSDSSPLTELGERQSLALGRRIKDMFQQAGIQPSSANYFSSTAVRAKQTAILTMRQFDMDQDHLVSDDALLEQDMGTFEGALRSECYTPSVIEQIMADTHNFAAPGGESQKIVEDRVTNFVLKTVLPASSPEQPSIVFGHGMAFKCFLRHILNSDARMSRKIALENTSITELGWVPHDTNTSTAIKLQPGWHILRVNDTSHLADIKT